MDDCATLEQLSTVSIKKTEVKPAVDWKDAIVPKKIGGKTIYTCPTFPMSATIDPCDLNQIFSDHDEWKNFPANDGRAPFAGGPQHQSTERITRFGAKINKADFNALLRILELKRDRSADEKWQRWYDKGYMVTYHEALCPKTAGYLTQMRVISETILPYKFHLSKNLSSMPRQPTPMDEVLWLFIEEEKKKWDRWNGGQSLNGIFADSHNWDASLRFGIMKEDAFGSIIRIFSDASLRLIDFCDEE